MHASIAAPKAMYQVAVGLPAVALMWYPVLLIRCDLITSPSGVVANQIAAVASVALYLVVFVPLSCQFLIGLVVTDSKSELYRRLQSLLIFVPGTMYFTICWIRVHCQLFVSGQNGARIMDSIIELSAGGGGGSGGGEAVLIVTGGAAQPNPPVDAAAVASVNPDRATEGWSQILSFLFYGCVVSCTLCVVVAPRYCVWRSDRYGML